MIKHNFSNGNFVLHGITNIINNHHVSAWYDEDGNLLDCESVQNGFSKSIPNNWKHVRKAIQSWGKTMQHEEFESVADKITGSL